ncbi:MAG: EFR1 family ferrodoxin [Oscillospiraceae bacterium]|jgi:ferredoxin|nr:EFR1 family ferrodoxin [Oscillospiraceae bacterium]
MTVFYYTATGNSLAVAKQIGGTLVSIPQVVDEKNPYYKDDVIGIVFPIYWWSPPVLVRKFLENARFEADYIFAIGTYGSIVAGAMVSLQKYADKNEYRFDYLNQIVMLDNYIPVFNMSAQEKKLPKKLVAENTAKIAADIKERKQKKAAVYPWKTAMTAFMGNKFKPEKNAQKYIIDGKCNTCGVCAKVCPAKNIMVTDNVSFQNQCEGCLACLHLCPQNALHLKNEKNEKRWRNPDVTLDEIISANNRT